MLSDRRAIPPDAWLVFSIPDFPSAWKALAATPLYGDALDFLNSPAVADLPDYRLFMTRKRQIEAELGYQLTPDNLAEMLGGLDFVLLQPKKGGPSPAAYIFRVTDAPRFRRLVDFIEERMEDAAGGATSPTVTVKSLRYQGVEIVWTDFGSGFAVAELSPERFVMADSPETIRRIIDQVQKGEGLADHWRFRGAVGGLAQTEPHGFIYLDTRRARPKGEERGEHSPLSPVVRAMGRDLTLAADFLFEPEAIRFESFLPFAPPSKDKMAALYRHYPPGRLHSLDYISTSPLVFFARNTLDGPMVYDSLRAVVVNSLRTVAAGERNPEQILEMREENFRREMGFALRDDLAPAVGPEIFLSLEDIRFDPLVPLPFPDLVTGVQVRDSALMDKVVEGVRRYLERQLKAAAPAGAPPDRSPLQSAVYAGAMLTWFAVPRAPLYTIGYVRTSDFLLVGMGNDCLKRAIDRSAGRKGSFKDGRLYGRLRPYFHERCNGVFVLNVSEMAAVGREVAHRLKRGDPNEAAVAKRMEEVLRYIRRIEALGASSAGDENGLHTSGALIFKPRPKAPKRRR